MNDLINAVPEKYRPAVLLLIPLLPWIGRAYHALANGKGLAGAIRGVLFGTNTPAPASTPPAAPPAAPVSRGPILIGILAAALMIGASGCATSQQAVVYKSASAVQTALETAMNVYSDYLKVHPLPDATRAKVRDAYVKAEAALLVVIDAEEALGTLSAGNSTPADITAAQGQQSAALAQANQAVNDLVSLVRSFGVKI